MRKFLIALIVLAALLLAADFGARAYAESRTADAVQAQLSLTAAPDVSIEGFPFLYHAVRGEYPQVIMTSSNIDNGPLPGIRAVLTLSQVTLPLRDAVSGDTSQLAAQSKDSTFEDLLNKVSSKKGVTAAGLQSMRELEIERALRISFDSK